MKLNNILIIGVFSVISILAGCKGDIASADYDTAEVGKIKKVIPGVIISMRPVRLHNKNAENNLKSSNIDDMDTTMNSSHGFEYVIKLNSGSIISVVQAENIKLKIKQHILVIYGKNTRVVADNGSDRY